MSHQIQRCKHGVLYSQCRCPSPNRQVTIVPCTWTTCTERSPKSLTDSEIEEIAYAEIFQSARSMIEDWIDEEGEYSREDFLKIRAKALFLIRELEARYA